MKSVLMKIKKLVPRYYKAFYKVRKTKFNIKQLINRLKQDNPKVLLIGTPIHKNLGDHLIALAELQFLSKNFREDRIIDIPQDVYRVYKTRINRRIKNCDYIFISGGGWLGNVWEEDDKFLRDILKHFPNNKKFIFPQTLYFDNSLKNYHRVIRKDKYSFLKAKNYTICFREKNSYETAYSILKMEKDKCLLTPDIGLLYENKIKSENREKIGLVFRSDIEGILDLQEREKIISLLLKLDKKIDIFSTISEKLVSLEERETCVNNIIKRFGKCKYVITDRLHAMVFCILSNTPCIIFDNLTHKVRGVYETWLTDSQDIYFVKNFNEFCNAINRIEVQKSSNYMQLKNIFEEMARLITLQINKEIDNGNK